MTPDEEAVRVVIAQQAADWFVTNQSGPGAEAERAAFMGWLRTSPLHVEEYLRIAAISRDLGRAAADPAWSLDGLIAEARTEASPEATAARPRPGWLAGGPRWLRRTLLGGVAAVAAALLAGVVLPWMGQREEAAAGARYATVHGEQRSWNLPDGSTLQLNTDSEAWVRFSSRERLVVLRRGQAYFAVAHDPQRRFRVTFGGADVVAVGTQFDIYRQDGASVLTVVEGRVAVYGRRAPAPAPGMALRAPAASVVAGEQLHFAVAEVSGPPMKADLSQSESWRSRRIVFDEQPLAQVVAEFNRYAAIPVEVTDPKLGAVRISGALDAGDLNSLVAFLGAIDNVVVTRTVTVIQVARRVPASHRSVSPPPGV